MQMNDSSLIEEMIYLEFLEKSYGLADAELKRFSTG
jgi:hypothetical protein